MTLRELIFCYFCQKKCPRNKCRFQIVYRFKKFLSISQNMLKNKLEILCNVLISKVKHHFVKYNGRKVANDRY